MKKSLLILAIISIYTLKTNELTQNLAALEINLTALSNLIPKPQKKAIDDTKRMEDIKTIFTNYNNNPQKRHLNELNDLFIGLNESEYATMLEAYNEYIDEYKDDEEKITETQLETIAAFTAWHTNELKIAGIEPAMKKLEKIYLNDKFQRIPSLSTKSVLESMILLLDEFDTILNEQKAHITLYTKWPNQIKNPTYEIFNNWSKAKRQEIKEQLPKIRKTTFTPPTAGTIAKKTYCKFPKGTQLTINGKTITIDEEEDLSTYQDGNKNLLNVESITVFQEGIKGKLQPIAIKSGKTYSARTAQMEIEWLPNLPEGSGWCQ